MINRVKESFTMVDNSFLSKKDVSLKAKGLYAFLCSKPDGWEFSMNGLEHQLKEGEKAIREGLKEIEKEGFLLKVAKKGENNKFSGWEWIINPTHEDLENSQNRKFLKQEFPNIGSSGNGEEISNNKLSNTNLSNNIYTEENFSSFWKLYPKKIDRKKCVNLYKEKLKVVSHEHIMEGLAKYLKAFEHENYKYVVYPERFFKYERYNDVYDTDTKQETPKDSFPDELKSLKGTLQTDWKLYGMYQKDGKYYDNSGYEFCVWEESQGHHIFFLKERYDQMMQNSNS